VTTKTAAHLHLPRFKAGNPANISVKVGDEPVYYASRLLMRNVTFKVSEAGRQRMLREGHKNVHAWVVGEQLPWPVCFSPDTAVLREAKYNPVKGATFVDAEDGGPVYGASLVVMVGSKVYYMP
jgi:hypothetical protein